MDICTGRFNLQYSLYVGQLHHDYPIFANVFDK